MRRRIEGFRRRYGLAGRLASLVLMLMVLAGLAGTVMLSYDVVTVTDSDGRTQTLLTASTEPGRIIQMAGLTVAPEDKVVYTVVNATAARVEITRAFPVLLRVDGQTKVARLPEGTVADLLATIGVQVGPEDIVEPALDTRLTEGLTARVKRVAYVDEVRREELPAETAQAHAERLGVEEFVQSTNGIYDVTYRDRLEDGLLVSSEVLEVVPLVVPRPEDSYEIIMGVPCSRIEGYDDIEMGVDGRPQNYSWLMTDAICTAYSSSGGRGASGLGLYCGTVAVNPNVIPYGTRMFITSADGSFVYGFAIATDTGTALMEGRIDIDLYFETNAECLQFGKRLLQVYVLD